MYQKNKNKSYWRLIKIKDIIYRASPGFVENLMHFMIKLAESESKKVIHLK